MCKKISGAVEAFIRDEIMERVEKERAALTAKRDEIEKKLGNLDEEIGNLEESDECAPDGWNAKKRKLEKELRVYFKTVRKNAAAHIKAVLAKNGLTDGNCSDFEDIASNFFGADGDDYLEWYEDVLPANSSNNNDALLKKKQKEYDKLEAEFDKIDAEVDKFDARITKATGKVCLLLMTGKSIKEIDNLIKEIDNLIKNVKI